MEPKSVQNQRKIDFAAFWMPRAVSGTRPDALVTVLGHPNASPRPILGCPGRAKIGPKASKSFTGPVPRPSQTTLEHCVSAFGAPSAVEHARGMIFRCFCVVARKLRCVFRISFNGVLLTSHEVSTARARTATTYENPGVLASKIQPRSFRAT